MTTSPEPAAIFNTKPSWRVAPSPARAVGVALAGSCMTALHYMILATAAV
jgi:hypothetical protein